MKIGNLSNLGVKLQQIECEHFASYGNGLSDARLAVIHAFMLWNNFGPVAIGLENCYPYVKHSLSRAEAGLLQPKRLLVQSDVMKARFAASSMTKRGLLQFPTL